MIWYVYTVGFDILCYSPTMQAELLWSTTVLGTQARVMSQLTWPTTTRIKSSLRVEGVISLLPAIVWVCVAVNDSLSRYCLTARHRNLKLNRQDAVCWIWCWNAWTREVFLGIKAIYRSICVDSAPGVGNAWAACLAYGTCRAARTRGKAGKTGWWRLVWDHAALSVWHDPYSTSFYWCDLLFWEWGLSSLYLRGQAFPLPFPICCQHLSCLIHVVSCRPWHSSTILCKVSELRWAALQLRVWKKLLCSDSAFDRSNRSNCPSVR